MADERAVVVRALTARPAPGRSGGVSGPTGSRTIGHVLRLPPRRPGESGADTYAWAIRRSTAAVPEV
ncbi:hypothetical protein GCM10010381_07280 [Streptomyces xantholiticus]|nr:hypothetical protein GCM10010381_07280 [Streptomyces xantholiticus]